MSSIRFDHVHFAHHDRAPLLCDAHLHLQAGWTGLVGENGAGKTTLLRLIAGELVPGAGRVVLAEGARVAFCRQRVDDPDQAVRKLADDFDRAALRIKSRLGLLEAELERWDSLSPGERRRWQLGAALHARPDVLLLDEPTNHVDAATRELLVDSLARFRGIGLIVSHDRALLDGLCTATLRIAGAQLAHWSLPYSQAREVWRAEAAANAEQHRALRRNAAQLRRQAHVQRERLQQGEARGRVRARSKGVRDSDARSTSRKMRAARASASASQSLGAAISRADQAEAQAEQSRMRRSVGRSIGFDHAPSPKRRLATLQLGELCAGERVLLSDLSLVLERDSRWCFTGPNGAGKSTLLRALAHAIDAPPGRVLFLPQEVELSEGARQLAALRAQPPEQRSAVLELVAALGSDPDHLLASACPSPGETRKLLIARGLAQRVWALLLDEPTNHLDLPTIERLEAALARYPGALVMVSHDLEFAEACGAERFTLTEGTLVRDGDLARPAQPMR